MKKSFDSEKKVDWSSKFVSRLNRKPWAHLSCTPQLERKIEKDPIYPVSKPFYFIFPSCFMSICNPMGYDRPQALLCSSAVSMQQGARAGATACSWNPSPYYVNKDITERSLLLLNPFFYAAVSSSTSRRPEIGGS